MRLAQISKFLTALAGAAAQVIASGLVEGDAQQWLTIAIGVLTAAAVYMVPNQQAAVEQPSRTPAAD